MVNNVGFGLKTSFVISIFALSSSVNTSVKSITVFGASSLTITLFIGLATMGKSSMPETSIIIISSVISIPSWAVKVNMLLPTFSPRGFPVKVIEFSVGSLEKDNQFGKTPWPKFKIEFSASVTKIVIE